MLFSILRKVPTFAGNFLQSHLPQWFLPRLLEFARLLPLFSNLQCTHRSQTAIMDENIERNDRLEPLKTLHETRANDQYGKLPLMSPGSLH